MIGILKGLAGWLTTGALDRVLQTVDKRTQAGVDRDKLRADVIRTHMETRAGVLAAGGFWLTLLAGLPFVLHAAAVCIYSVFWCADCAFPKPWTIAALPPPFDEQQAEAIMVWLGVVGVTSIAAFGGRLRRR